MANAVASAIFTFRNVRTAANTHNPIRAGVAAANGTKVASALSSSEVMKTAGKVAGKVVNPLIVASAAYNVYRSDDKIKTSAKEGLGLAGMFFFESQMKHGKVGELAAKGSRFLMEKCTKNVKAQNVGTFILTGIAFVCASITGYKLGSKTGTTAVDLIRRSDPSTQKNDFVANYSLSDDQPRLNEKA